MAERIHSALGALAVVILAGGGLAWRFVGAAGQPAIAAPMQSSRFSQLMPYATPLPDSVQAVASWHAPVAIARDPFSPREMNAVVPRMALREAPSAPRTVQPRWDVTAILIAGARRAALINGVLVNMGDPAPGGATLTAVERDRVVLTDPRGTAHTVAVKEGES